MSQEYYIRTEDSDEARGPYTVDQLQSLAEAKKIDRETLCYDEKREVWIQLGKFDELRQDVFPERRKLSLKSQDEGQDAPDQPGAVALKDPEEDIPESRIEDILAAAEGRTEDTEHITRRQQARDAAARMALPGLGIILALLGISLIYPHGATLLAAVDEGTYLNLLDPLLMIGLLDIIWAVFLFLGVSEIFPILRLRAALGLGFWAYVFWSGGDPTLAFISAAGHLGLFICTITLRLHFMVLGLVAGIAAAGLLTYLSVSGQLAAFL